METGGGGVPPIPEVVERRRFTENALFEWRLVCLWGVGVCLKNKKYNARSLTSVDNFALINHSFDKRLSVEYLTSSPQHLNNK